MSVGHNFEVQPAHPGPVTQGSRTEMQCYDSSPHPAHLWVGIQDETTWCRGVWAFGVESARDRFMRDHPGELHRWRQAGQTSYQGEATPIPGSKPTNPKDAVGIRKLAFSVLPWRVLTGVALGMMEGAAKYGRHNFRGVGVRASVYFDAVVARHLTQWWEGEDIDEDSGLHHIDKAIAGLMVMRDSMLQGNFTDDRPPLGGVDMDYCNHMAAEILDKHADKNPKHWTIQDQVNG